jgi:predicted alpha/beta-fold hydrolase
MPVKRTECYKSPFYLFTGDLQTIFPALMRKIPISYRRERIFTPDEDFLDLDWLKSSSPTENLVIISHGLEGSSEAPYAKGMAKALSENGFDVVVWNYRGCSGEINKLCRFYHSGETEDLHFVLNHLSQTSHKKMFLVGFSIGGNITLKYLGEKRQIPEKTQAAVAISVPCHLESTAIHLAKLRSKIYMNRFLTSLKSKIKAKANLYPNELSVENLDLIKDFHQFDTIYTAPLHCFPSAKEYWRLNSSINYLHNIDIPTLILNAENDPFLTAKSFPVKEAEENKNILLEIPKEGGHCGFYQSGKSGIYWSEKRTIEFFKEIQ